MYVYVYQHRVRYRECDPMGVVYHTHYLDYFEAARTEALRELGLAYKKLEESGIMMPVVDLSVQYKRPARYDDLLEIRAIFDELPGMRATIRYEVVRAGEDEILTTGHVALCFIDAARSRPVPAPEPVLHAFRQVLPVHQPRMRRTGS
ncbi:MAG TPA: thioesterase family protein [Rhodothermales bacterium]|nr:thioesterase family protein [Rhodothermales bacterium]